MTGSARAKNKTGLHCIVSLEISSFFTHYLAERRGACL